MKIVYYSPHPHLNLGSPSGYGTHMREMIAAFEEEGHSVKPVIMGGTTMPKQNLGIQGRSPLKKLIAKMVPSLIWESAKDLKLLRFDSAARNILDQAVGQFKPDLIYERASYLQTSGAKVAKTRGIPYVIEVNSPFIEERKVLQGNSMFLKRAIEAEKEIFGKADKIVVVSSALKDFFIKTYGIDPDKFIITPNAINPGHIQFDRFVSEELKQKLHLENKTVVGFVGSIFPWHGVDILIQAFAGIQREYPATHLLIVGDGETLPQLKEMAAHEGLSQKITFTGNVPHKSVFNYIDLMDICVSPKSHWYGSPVKIFEYGALGKAIIAPDNIPVRDVMAHKITGLLSEGTSESLGENLKLYLQDQELRNNCATAFREKVLLRHTWKQNAEMVLNSLPARSVS